MSATASADVPDAPTVEPVPDYILNACEAAAEWWAKSDQDPRIKFTPSVILKLLTAIREGMHYEPACALAGVSYAQLRNWLNRAEDEGELSPFAVVARAVKVAEAEAENESVRYVRAASRDPRFWAAGMTFLERRHPDRWRRPDAAQNVQVNVGVALGVQVSDETHRAQLQSVDGQIVQMSKESADRPALGTALSPAPETLTALSLPQPIAVSGDNREANATPNGGVSPASVA